MATHTPTRGLSHTPLLGGWFAVITCVRSYEYPDLVVRTQDDGVNGYKHATSALSSSPKFMPSWFLLQQRSVVMSQDQMRGSLFLLLRTRSQHSASNPLLYTASKQLRKTQNTTYRTSRGREKCFPITHRSTGLSQVGVMSDEDIF